MVLEHGPLEILHLVSLAVEVALFVELGTQGVAVLGEATVRTERTATIARTYRRGGVTVQLRPRGSGLYAYALYWEAPQGKRRQASKQVRKYLGKVTLVLQEDVTP